MPRWRSARAPAPGRATGRRGPPMRTVPGRDVVLAQQQAQDGGLAPRRWGRPRPPSHRRRRRSSARHARRCGDRDRRRPRPRTRCRSADRRRSPGHACRRESLRASSSVLMRSAADCPIIPLMQHAAQVAQGPEYLGAGHQDNQQAFHGHLDHACTLARPRPRWLPPPPTPVSEINVKNRVSNPSASTQNVLLGQAPCPLCQALGKGGALAERLQGWQALQPVQELLAERLERGGAGAGGAFIGVVYHEWAARGSTARPISKTRSGGHVPPCQHGEDHHRGAGGDDDLRHVGAEKGLSTAPRRRPRPASRHPSARRRNQAGPSSAMRSNSRGA